jgi:hypothetical protein
MRIIFVLLFLFTLISCHNKEMKASQRKTETKNPGSTLKNINEAEHRLLEFEVENKMCLALINQNFRGYKHKRDFPFSLWITVETKNKNLNGHPIQSEALLFNKIEDSLIRMLAGSTPFCFIGRTTRDGYREIMIYGSDRKKLSETMNRFVRENTFGRNINFQIDDDDNWGSVSGFY